MNQKNALSRNFRLRELHKFEEAVVDELLNHYGLKKKWRKKLLRNHKNKADEWRLALEAFHEQFPAYPLRFKVANLRDVANQHPFSKLICKFDMLPMWEAFLDGRETDEDPEKSFGMVFKWPYLNQSKGALVLHDYPVDLTSDGLRLVYRNEHLDAPVVLETLDGLLTGMEAADNSNIQFWLTPNSEEDS